MALPVSKIVSNDLRIASTVSSITFVFIKLIYFIMLCKYLGFLNDKYTELKDIMNTARKNGDNEIKMGEDFLNAILKYLVLFCFVAILCLLDIVLGLILVLGSVKKMSTVLHVTSLVALASLALLMMLLSISDYYNSEITIRLLEETRFPDTAITMSMTVLNLGVPKYATAVYLVTLAVVFFCARKLTSPVVATYRPVSPLDPTARTQAQY